MTIDIEALAREAGLWVGAQRPDLSVIRPGNIERFAALVAEQCAQLVFGGEVGATVARNAAKRRIRAAFPMPKE